MGKLNRIKKRIEKEEKRLLALSRLKERKDLSFFIGSELEKITKNEIIVKKDGKRYAFEIVENDSYSDWWEVFASMLTEENEMPVITNIIEHKPVDNSNQTYYKLVFFGLNKPIAEMSAIFHNDSDWNYGCTVAAYCTIKKDLKKFIIFK